MNRKGGEEDWIKVDLPIIHTIFSTPNRNRNRNRSGA